MMYRWLIPNYSLLYGLMSLGDGVWECCFLSPPYVHVHGLSPIVGDRPGVATYRVKPRTEDY
jgi:hypothetical protein